MTPPPESFAPKFSAAPWIALGVGALVIVASFAVAAFMIFRAAGDAGGMVRRELKSPSTADPGRAAAPAEVPPFEQGNPRGFDHWHVAFGFYVCDAYLPILEDPGRDPDGIHTHGDGVIHVHPFHGGAAGENAVMAVFEEAAGISLDADGFSVPGAIVETGDGCGGTPGEIRFLVNGDEVVGDPSDYRFADMDVVVLALVAPGDDVPPLPWASTLFNLSDVPNSA